MLRWFKRAGLAAALAGACLGATEGCSSERSPERTGTAVSELLASDVLGFESLAGWTLSAGSVSATTNRTQGASAFALVPNGYVQLTSVPLSTLSGVTSTLALDFAMPSTPPNPFWLGTLQLFVNIPSQGIFNVSIGQTDLSTLPLGSYQTVQYTVPANVLTALRGTYSDLQFILTVNVPSSTTATYLIDNLRFVGAGTDAGSEAGADGGGDGGGSGADAGRDAGDSGTDAGDSGSLCGACPSGTACAPNGQCASTDLTVWPNTQSQANSDPWISQHHDQIRDLHPKVLAIDFANHANGTGTTTFQEMLDTINNHMIPGLTEGSRFHGYSNASAPAMLHYELLKAIDLSNPTVPTPPNWNHLNSSAYPRKCVAGAPYQFDYSALFNATFTGYYGIRAPGGAGNLSLCQMIQSGVVHEVWVYVDGDPDAWTANGQNLVCANGTSAGDFQLPEDLGMKQVYDAQNRPVPGQFDACNGDGDGVSACFSADDAATLTACGRTIRILYINSARGSGCAMHSLGHGFEGIARSPATGGPLPYLWPNWRHFANFDLDTRFAAPFQNWYGVCSGNCIAFTGPSPFNALTWQSANESPTSGSMNPYNQGCGSVHFPPNARGDYDYGYSGTNTNQVLNTCAGYGTGPAGFASDPTSVYVGDEPYVARANLPNNESYESLAPDTGNVCGGGWQIYWRQNFPGLGNAAKDANGNPMKVWWPFLFY
jgi:hypothetical protein